MMLDLPSTLQQIRYICWWERYQALARSAVPTSCPLPACVWDWSSTELRDIQNATMLYTNEM
jgi:hypothetical protein